MLYNHQQQLVLVTTACGRGHGNSSSSSSSSNMHACAYTSSQTAHTFNLSTHAVCKSLPDTCCFQVLSAAIATGFLVWGLKITLRCDTSHSWHQRCSCSNLSLAVHL